MFLSLVVAGTTLMAATISTTMAIGTGLTTVGFTLFDQGLVQINNAETRFTGAFHLSDGGHGVTPRQQ